MSKTIFLEMIKCKHCGILFSPNNNGRRPQTVCNECSQQRRLRHYRKCNEKRKHQKNHDDDYNCGFVGEVERLVFEP